MVSSMSMLPEDVLLVTTGKLYLTLTVQQMHLEKK